MEPEDVMEMAKRAWYEYKRAYRYRKPYIMGKKYREFVPVM